jgi:hypothetical protein
MTTPQRLTLSAEAIPVSHSASPEDNEASAIRATSGRICIVSYENSGLDGSFAKTLLGILNSVSTPYSLTWRMRDTRQQRSLFQLVPSGRLTGGTVYGLLPTPLASDGRGRWGRKDDTLLRNYLPRRFGGAYPHPSLVEAMMGFPSSWSDFAHWETPSSLRSRN